MICAWCPDFDPKDPANKDASHGMCPACVERWNAECAKLEAEEAAVEEAVALLHAGEEE